MRVVSGIIFDANAATNYLFFQKKLRNMKTLSLIIGILFLSTMHSFGQSKTRYHERVREEKSSLRKARTDTSDVTAIIKDSSNAETGPILNDNGTVSTTGTIDGRSSTGRPDADSTTSYTTKRSKKTIKQAGAVLPDTTRKRKNL
jgi:hypothetical protein